MDFFVPKERYAVQAAYSIADDLTRKREASALVKLAQKADLEKLEIVTYNEENTLIEDGVTIEVVPVWKWLL